MIYALAFLGLFIIWDWIGDLVLLVMGLGLIAIGIPLLFILGGIGLAWVAYG